MGAPSWRPPSVDPARVGKGPGRSLNPTLQDGIFDVRSFGTNVANGSCPFSTHCGHWRHRYKKLPKAADPSTTTGTFSLERQRYSMASATAKITTPSGNEGTDRLTFQPS